MEEGSEGSGLQKGKGIEMKRGGGSRLWRVGGSGVGHGVGGESRANGKEREGDFSRRCRELG